MNKLYPRIDDIIHRIEPAIKNEGIMQQNSLYHEFLLKEIYKNFCNYQANFYEYTHRLRIERILIDAKY